MIKELSLLTGKWKGRGVANFPTIERTEYIEELEFDFIGDDETIMFDQRTWKIENGEKAAPLHWEAGYIIALESGKFDLFNAQNSRRVEVMTSTQFISGENKLTLLFESKYFGNDERMQKTARDFIIENNSLHFIMKMATAKTPEFQLHLESRLIREIG